MKRAVTRIKEEIARLEEELRAAEAKQAERIGRLALRAGLGDCQVEDERLLAGLSDLAESFRKPSPPFAVPPAEGAVGRS